VDRPGGFFSKLPALTETGFTLLKWLPVFSIIALAGMWFLKSWGAYLAIICGMAIIIADIYFGIYYHLYAAIPSTVLMIALVIKYRDLLQ
jgi:uncharacterized membrane protein (DUF2068 family)